MPSKTTKGQIYTRKRRVREFGYDDKILLIEQVQNRPILWDLNDKKHFDSTYLRKAWASVASDLDKDVTSCKLAWKSLRDSHRYFSKTRHLKGPNSKSRGWRLASHMSFLPDISKDRRPTRTSFNPVDREDSDPPAELDEAETASIPESDISEFIDETKDLDKDLSNWTEDLYSSVGKIRVKKPKLSPSIKGHSHEQQNAYSRPIFAYWESILNKMSPEDADAAEQQMTQALWAEVASIKYKNSN